MTDREMLELSAKAIGLRLEWDGPPDSWQPMYYEGKTYHDWAPLDNNEDATRLMVEIGAAGSWFTGRMMFKEACEFAVAEAARRAITNAAAEQEKAKA